MSTSVCSSALCLRSTAAARNVRSAAVGNVACELSLRVAGVAHALHMRILFVQWRGAGSQQQRTHCCCACRKVAVWCCAARAAIAHDA